MLRHLSITNYAIIKNLELEINDGFTVITGETGAGKSILVGALSLILGKRADTTVLNDKSKKCIVEVEFDFQEQDYVQFFKENDLDFDNPNLIRREISSKGKSRAFINDTPVSLTVLKELTSKLIDIHSQHQTLAIQDNNFQLNVVDAFARLTGKVQDFSKKYSSYKKNKHQLNQLIEFSNKANSDVDYISFQLNEIEELALKPNEKENLLAELEILNNAEEIKLVLENSGNALLNSEHNIITELKKVSNSIAKICNCSENYNAIYDRLNSIIIELEDITSDIDNNNQNLNYSIENLNYLNERLGKIFSIEQKHNLSSTKEIIELAVKLKQQLKKIDVDEDGIKELRKFVAKQEKELSQLAEILSQKRSVIFKKLSATIELSLNKLGMSDASFQVKHQLLKEFNSIGIDNISFYFTSNKGVESKELKKAASGGELSRLMLTIKSILAQNSQLSTIVFDEIDAGISGDIADKMANIMKIISNKMQVIAITHLPQIAAKGDTHYKIYKENVNETTLALISKLSKSERIEELAKMLSGTKLSTAARNNAKILLEN